MSLNEISNVTRGSRAWWRAMSSYAPKVKKTGKRLPIAKRRVMVEAFVNRYRGDNSGKFPTVSHAKQEVGGSYYVVRKIMQELEYNSKLPSSSAGKEVSSETKVRNSHLWSGLKSNAENAREEEPNQCIQQPLLDVSCAKKCEDSKEETRCESVPDVDSSESQNEEHQPSHECSIPNIPENSKEEHRKLAGELSEEQMVENIQTKSSIWGTLKSAFINIWRKQ